MAVEAARDPFNGYDIYEGSIETDISDEIRNPQMFSIYRPSGNRSYFVQAFASGPSAWYVRSVTKKQFQEVEDEVIRSKALSIDLQKLAVVEADGWELVVKMGNLLGWPAYLNDPLDAKLDERHYKLKDFRKISELDDIRRKLEGTEEELKGKEKLEHTAGNIDMTI